MSTVLPPSTREAAVGPTAPLPRQTDPRGMRFAAALTTLVLVAVLLTQSTVLLAAQAAVFAIGGSLGVRRSPYAVIFATTVRPRLGPPAETEDARPPQFAQLVGLVFAVGRAGGLLAGPTAVGLIATGFALAAAFLNAVFGLCLGCELYLMVHGHPLSPRPTALLHSTAPPAAPPGPSQPRRYPHEPRRRTRRRRLGREPSRRRQPGESSWSRSTKTPRPTTRATSREPSRSTGSKTSRTRSAATSSTSNSSRSCSPSAGSATTTPSCCTAATTTGSPPTRTGTSSSTATTRCCCSTADARSGSSTPVS